MAYSDTMFYILDKHYQWYFLICALFFFFDLGKNLITFTLPSWLKHEVLKIQHW